MADGEANGLNGHNGTPAILVPDLPEAAWAPPLDQYRELACRDSEAPEAFHWAAIVAVIGQLFGRRVSHYYAGDIYLNFQFILIGPTGTKKSTPLNLAPRLLGDLCRTEKVRPLWGVSTGEGLLSELAKDEGTKLMVCLNELRALFTRAKRDGNQQFVSILIDLIDAIDQVDLPTKTNSLHVIRPFMSILAAATAESLEDSVGENEVYGGLLNRFVPVAGRAGPPQPFPRRPDPGKAARFMGTLDDILARSSGTREIELPESSEAGEAWAEYYTKLYERRGQASEGMTALTQRQHTHVRRFALFYAALRGGAVIELDDLLRALEVVGYVDQVVQTILHPITINQASKLDAKIESLLRECPLTKRQLHQRLSGRVKGSELKRALDTLIEMQRVTEFRHDTDGIDLLKWEC